MFQVATAYVLAKHYNTDFKLDLSFLQKNNVSTERFTARNYELNAFNYKFEFANKKDIDFFFPKNKNLIKRIIRKIKRTIYKPIIINDNWISDNFIEKTSKYTYLDGYWQSENYFKNYRNDILKLFQFPKLNTEYNNIEQNISKTNSVSVHFRRGDYSTNKYIKSVHGICSFEYYKKAINFVYRKQKNIKLFLFSDDVNWVKNNFHTKFEFEIVKTKSAIDDMQLMSLCKHNIIANSSFSWWGAWLNQNATKIVIAPKKWFADTEKNKQTKDLIPKDWIQI